MTPLQAVAAALHRFMLQPVHAEIGQKRMMLMALTTCVQQHGFCTYDLESQREVTQAVMLLQAVAGALGRSMPKPVLDKIGQKEIMLMTPTSCAMFQPVIVPVVLYRLPAERAWACKSAVR